MNKFPYHFPGISVIVPNSMMIAINKGIQDPKSIRAESDGFKLIRIIGNICIFHSDDLKNPIKKFDPPIKIRVGYNMQDVMQCEGDINQLKLAYWDGETWVVVSNPEHEYQILPFTTGQIAEFEITTWVGDPPVAWGR
jgi:hypothetical protein